MFGSENVKENVIFFTHYIYIFFSYLFYIFSRIFQEPNINLNKFIRELQIEI